MSSRRLLRLAWLVAQWVAIPVAFAAENALPEGSEIDGCITLHALNWAQMSDFNFDGYTSPLSDLNPDQSYRVGDIRVVRMPIFDPSNPRENNWLYGMADRLHIDTRESVIRHVILPQSGQMTTLEELEESERILRNKSYLYDARIVPRRLCGNRLDIDVVTKEVWSLDLELNVARSGGENDFGVGLNDSNFLGGGRSLGIGYSENLDRQGVHFSYSDPNVGGSRLSTSLFLANNDDGDRQLLDVRKPFYSLEARSSLGLRLDKFDQEQGLYFLGNQFAEFRHQSLKADLFGGFSDGLQQNSVRRFLYGLSFEEDDFEPISVFSPTPFPEDRKLVYPWVGIESIENDFQKTENFDQIYRTEDLFLGRHYLFRLGYSNQMFGGDDQSRLVLQGTFRDASWVGKKHLLVYGASLDGYYNFEQDSSEDLQLAAFANYRFSHSKHFSLYASITAAYVKNLPADKQLLLGGDSGLRGYPNRYQLGDRRFIFTLEERYFSDLYLFNLFRLGAAVFLDVGRAWSPDFPSANEFGALSDVGLGLRIESTRTRRNRILHVDLAFPLQDGPDVGGAEFTVKVKQSL